MYCFKWNDGHINDVEIVDYELEERKKVIKHQLKRIIPLIKSADVVYAK